MKIKSEELKIIVGTYPTMDLNLKSELNLIKTGILYGDKVVFHNFKYDMFDKIYSLLNAPKEKRFDVMENVLPVFKDTAGIKDFLDILKITRERFEKKHLSNDEYISKTKLYKQLDSLWPEVQNNIASMFPDTEIKEIYLAIKSNLVEIESYDSNEEGKILSKLFVKNLTSSLSESNSYPLFDFDTSDLIKYVIEENKVKVSNSNLMRGNELKFISKLFEKLPLFEEASIDEIIDIKKELQKPLIRFRSGIKEISSRVKDVFWNKEFSSDIHELIIKEIEPSILEIEELLNENSYLKTLVKRALKSQLFAGVSTAAAIGVIISGLSTLPSMILPASLLATESYSEYKEKKNQTEKNYLFFYYKLSKLL